VLHEQLCGSVPQALKRQKFKFCARKKTGASLKKKGFKNGIAIDVAVNRNFFLGLIIKVY
jgi:hypothetical protein